MAYAQPLASSGLIDLRGNPLAAAASATETEQQTKSRKLAMQNAYKAYNGQMDEPLKVKPGDLNDNAVVGLMRPIIETGVSFLFGKAVSFEVATADEDGDGDEMPTPVVSSKKKQSTAKKASSPAQDALDLAWRANKQSTLLKKLATNGALFGHVFVKIVPKGIIYKKQAWPRLILLDSTQMDIFCDPDDVDLVTEYVQEWPGVDDDGMPCTRRQRTVRLMGGSGASGANASDPDAGGRLTVALGAPSKWQIIDEHLSAGGVWLRDYTELWPYDWCPIHECQNLPEANSKWGAPNVTAALIRLNGLLNFLVSNATRISKHHAHPKPWTAGARMDEWRVAVDEAINMAAPDARIGQLEMNGNGMANLLTLIDMVRDFIDELSHVPGIALGRLKDMPRGGVSGIALELMFAALLEQTEDKRELYGDLLDSINAHMLEMCGQGTDLDVSIIWPDVLPQDIPTMATAAPLLIQSGISQDSVIKWLGWNPDEEAEKNRQALEQEKAQAAEDAANNPPPPSVAPGAAQPTSSSDMPMMMGAQQQPTKQPPAGNLNHPAMQQARAVAMSAAKTRG